MRHGKNKKLIILVLFFSVFYLPISTCCSAEDATTITSDTLEYNQETFTYIAKDNVKIKKVDISIGADEIIYNEKTSEVTATGSFIYNDKDVSIIATKAELNLDARTGIIYDAEILFKNDNYHISGGTIEKKGDKHYSSPEAAFTTCDGPVPAWCFRGKDIDVVIGEHLKARNVTFRIKNIPVLYTPYFRAPIQTERKTGFLTFLIGQSESRGFNLNIPFYWAIAENRDLTVNMDYYTKRGLGKGIEYRYIEPFDAKGRWWFYHLRDRELKKDFYEIRMRHEHRPSEKINGFLNINYINEKDYYREFTDNIEVRTNRFLESNGEVSVSFDNSRAYLLSQYWIDLKEKNLPVPQKLPETGFILNPTNVGSILFSSAATLSNFWREEGIYGQRLDIYPKIFHAFGNDIIIAQTLGLRETVYSLQRYNEGNILRRESLGYNIKANTRLIKRYRLFTHLLEPSLSYTFVAISGNDLPLFDSTELFKKKSLVEVSLLNRITNRYGRELLVIRASQGFDSYHGDRAFQPFKVEVGIKKPISLRLETDYDVHKGKVESINSDLSVNIFNAIILASQRYNREEDIAFYNAGIGINPYKPLFLETRIWYDAKEKEAKDITMNLKYIRQCWGFNILFNKRPDDFNIGIMIELKGITKNIRI
ncbi:MAG: LPS-assembly protein LptD [Nitrospirae bacterium]|nr:LPS-assembly protein LptD [Nitrospirota bacterium]